MPKGSDSQRPSDAQIARQLVLTTIDRLDASEDVSVNDIRNHATSSLGLAADYFKSDSRWKAISKNIINKTFDAPEAFGRLLRSSEDGPFNELAGIRTEPRDAQPTKQRRSPQIAPPRKRQKASVAPESEDESQGSAKEEPPTTSTTATGKSIAHGDQLEENDDSDLSSLIDDHPPKRQRTKKSVSSNASKPAKSKSAKANPGRKPSADNTLTADEEEVKRLQGWLLKCGVRKLWHKELAHCDTDKAKVKHLKKMLEDVGMSGRYSVEKARNIKESRELAAELEAAKEFNEQWGQTNESDAEEEGKPPGRRLKPKGLVDFGDSDDDSDD